MSIENIKDNIYQPKGNENASLLAIKKKIQELKEDFTKNDISFNKVVDLVDNTIESIKTLEEEIEFIKKQLSFSKEKKDNIFSKEKLISLENKISLLREDLNKSLDLNNKLFENSNKLVLMIERLYLSKQVIEETVKDFKEKLLKIGKEKEN